MQNSGRRQHLIGWSTKAIRLVGVLTLALCLTATSAEAGHPDTKRARHSVTSISHSSGKNAIKRKRRGIATKTKKVAARRPQQQIGALVMTENGEILMDSMADAEFNPASVAKVVTAYGAMKVFGLDHQFSTTVSYRGNFDEKTGVFTGDIFVQGADPDFDRADAQALYQELEYAGVKHVKGRLVVSSGFSYCSAPDAAWSGKSMLRSWHHGRKTKISFQKGVAVGSAPPDAIFLAEQKSEIFRDTLKEMLSYSQNGVAEQIGRAAGGIKSLEEIVCREAGLPPNSLKLVTASGLGKNRIKPRDMMAVIKALRSDLRRQGLDFQDILPVAGIDAGTLDERFTGPEERGSVVGKTGSLPGTDGGTSTLVGMFRCQQEDVYFVIFCWRGNVPSFRNQQDNLIRHLQATRGGPRPYDYKLGRDEGA